MNLYHFTAARYVELIREHGILSLAEKSRRGIPALGLTEGGQLVPLPVESLAVFRKTAFPFENELVWLTRNPAPSDLHPWAQEVRVTVDIEAKSWRTAADRYAVPLAWRRILRDSGGNERDWYVVEGFIAPERVVTFDELVLD